MVADTRKYLQRAAWGEGSNQNKWELGDVLLLETQLFAVVAVVVGISAAATSSALYLKLNAKNIRFTKRRRNAQARTHSTDVMFSLWWRSCTAPT